MFIRSIATLVASVITCTAFATNMPPADPRSSSSANAHADAEAYSTARSASSSSIKSSVDVASDQQQSQTQHQEQSQSSSADNAGNAQTVSYNTPRQVPPVFLPALMVSDCGAGANAGASDSGGAGALGVVWTTKRCYALRSAINFFAIGEYETGCKLLTYVNREALRAINEKPDCVSIAQRLTIESEHVEKSTSLVPPVDLSKYATREELERAFKKAQSK